MQKEALLRSALSRGYYGAYGHAKYHAIAKKGFQPKDEATDHVELARLFIGKFQQVGKRLRELRRLRNKADYEDDASMQWEDATAAALIEAKKVIDALGPQ
ncbi:MAG: hypothetical protein L0Y72_02840 [Gemmataceae bacterium]|nr:hypothetical protein [Gemmataceae bacterium]MCI0737954.1 hypothetical protein [Gemmataceae bacterium]